MPVPIELRLSARKTRLVVGEGIVLDLNVRILAGVDVVSPELNRNRTSIRVEPANRLVPFQVFTGIDYVRVHRISPLAQIEDLAHAEAGAAWTVQVELLNYSSPLPTGVYSITISYRYGDAAADSVSTNTVQVEVTPAELGAAAYRWFGGASARDVLGSVWTVRTAEGEQWFYQCADAWDPGAVQFATAIGLPARRPGARPVLAHLNDIHAMHFKKYVVWEQDGAVGYVGVHREGRSEPGFVEHGLGPDARLIDPPLQQNDDSLLMLVLGSGANRQPACSLVSVPTSGASSARTVPLKNPAVQGLALWSAEPGSMLVLLRDSEGKVNLLGGGRTGETLVPRPVDGLVLSQWMGSGTLGGFFREGDFLHAFTLDPQGRGVKPRVAPDYEVARLPALPGRLASSAMGPSGGVVLAFETDRGWMVLDGGQVFVTPRPSRSTGTPRLIPAAGGLFLVHHDPNRGFLSELVGRPAPEPLI